MLTTNVLCMKKRKKRTYCLSSSAENKGVPSAKEPRSSGGAVTMLQITEDTPPDMLAGAMDLTVHLPSGRSVKMAVERSTPMMDLLVQITTNHHLQLSNYTLQALGMAPSSEHSDAVLPYKPNTPIGTLDTQHIKVIPKSRTLPVPKNIPPGHQPFESTFRLKVHLPRNQLYVTRVSRNVLLEDIMKKVCEEKNLDPMKYEFKHPGNLDEVLDPKLTLSDYQITEIYVVLKGTVSLNQAFSTSDIMALRKEEERKQMHTKTGGGVFNLIFRRGKSSMGSGSISSDTRSISPTHSDDSRSVTPPAVQQQIITPPKKDPPPERPKPPQRKRRPAPKPPQQNENSRKISVEKPPSNISENANEVTELQSKRVENGLTICHSRNSSDSSGYHEASVLSENCNTSLPRRPKSAFVTGGDIEKMHKQHSQSTTNLSKMSSHSKSTTSLGMAGRKKKAAPPPPPAIRSSSSSINLEKPSPVVASQPAITQKDTHCTAQDIIPTPHNTPVPLPRGKAKAPPKPRPRSEITVRSQNPEVSPRSTKEDGTEFNNDQRKSWAKESTIKTDNEDVINKIIEEELGEIIQSEEGLLEESSTNTGLQSKTEEKEPEEPKIEVKSNIEDSNKQSKHNADIEKNRNNSEKLDEFIKAHPHQVSGTNLETTITKSMPDISQLQKLTHENIFSSSEFLGERKPPEIVALIPKSTNDNKASPSKFDSFGRRRFQIGSSLVDNFDAETASTFSRQSSGSKTESMSMRNSINSALDAFNFVDDEFSDLDEKVFYASKSKDAKTTDEVFNQLFGIHNFESVNIDRNQSISSLRSLSSLPGFLNNGSGMKKWNNLEDLGDISLTSLDPETKWVVGDASDTESISQFPSNISPTLISITSCQSLTTDLIKIDEKSFGSTDSGIAQENHSDKQLELEINRPNTPPLPPPDFGEDIELVENIIPPPIISESTEIEEAALSQTEHKITEHKTSVEIKEQPVNETVQEPKCEEDIVKEPAKTNIIIPKKQAGESKNEKKVKNTEIGDIDWEYQLPSPPKAFRDSSPANFADVRNSDSPSVNDFKDSVVTSPELFEKLKVIEDGQSEKVTVTSDLTSVASEEEKPLLNTLSLENLEKRKSLVYNRELATSLKMTDTVDTSTFQAETFSSSLTQFESTYDEIRKSSLPKETIQPKFQKSVSQTHTLPNFKISTYDQPKQKIKVFEDDTIRSNTEDYNKAKTVVETKISVSATMRKSSYDGGSVENLSMRKNSLDSQSGNVAEERDYHFYRSTKTAMPRSFAPMSSVFRSESFSNENSWSPSKPVSRSKSHLTLNSNKYREERIDSTQEDSMSRSNSLFDVSGLQSLEVMRLIQNKLNTPTSSMENLTQKERIQKNVTRQEPKLQVVTKHIPKEEPQKPPTPEKTYKYRGPPSINMGTWSERPKVPVSVKEDADYKLSTNVSSKLIVNTTNNNITSNNSIEIKNNTSSTKINSTPPFGNGANLRINGFDHKEPSNVSIKVNGTEHISSIQNSGNVVIKIGSLSSQNQKSMDNQRFISHTTATGYRKPFSTVNKNQPTQRPHTVAFDSDFDISRVPVVRSVELKKHYKDGSNNNNTSVTQIYQGTNNFKSHTMSRTEPVSELKNKFSSMYKSSETLSNNAYLNHHNQAEAEKEPKPVFRVNSFKPNGAPVVRGFKTASDNATLNNRLSWNPPSANYNTLPAKPKDKDNYTTNRHVPFSQSNLRRTESSKIMERNSYNESKPHHNPVEINNEKNNTYNSLPNVTKSDIIKPPPPPQMPKVNLKKHVPKQADPNVDPRDQLLSAIRNFGGKKGLKPKNIM